MADVSSLKEHSKKIDEEILGMIEGAKQLKTLSKEFKYQNERLDAISD